MNAPDSGTTRYFYGFTAASNNGDFLFLGTNYGETGLKDIHPELNRYSLPSRNGSNPEYAFGPPLCGRIEQDLDPRRKAIAPTPSGATWKPPGHLPTSALEVPRPGNQKAATKTVWAIIRKG